MNTLDSYLFTDYQLAQEAAKHQAKKWKMTYAVVQSPASYAHFLVTSNYSHTAIGELLYVAEAPNG